MEPSGLPAEISSSELSRLAQVAVVIVVAEHSNRPLVYYQSIAAALKSAGGRAEVLHLPSVGIFGNSHLMAIEKNNLEIAKLAVGRLLKLMANNQR